MIKLEMYRGDDREFTLTLTEDGAPMDLTGATVRWTARVRAGDADTVIAKTSSAGIAIANDPTTGVAVLTIDAADTSGFAGRRDLVWDVEVTRGGKTRTVLTGVLRVLVDVSWSA